MNSALSVILGVLVVVLVIAVAALYVRTLNLRSRYKSITDAEAEGRRLRAEAHQSVEQAKAAVAGELGQLRKQIEE